MKIAIIAVILSVMALGFSGFATFTSLNHEEAEQVAALPTQSPWTAGECQEARDGLGFLRSIGCVAKGDCAPYADMLQAINDNCDTP
jgi:hypothetical protein